jgi:hypothetical protein
MPAHRSGRSAGTRHLITTALVGLVAAVLGVPMATAPAHGAVSTAATAPVAKAGTTGDAVTLTTHNESGYNVRCFRTAVEVTPQYDDSDSGTWDGHWSADVTIEDGSQLYSIGSYDGTAASKSFNLRVCDGHGLKRTYDVYVYWVQYDADGAAIVDGVTDGSFTYTLKPRAASRLTVTKDPYGSTGWRFAGRLARAGKPYAHQRVQLFIRWNGSWRDFEETKRTNNRGRVSWHTGRSLGKNHYVFRLRYSGNTTTKPGWSTRFRLNGR